MHKIAVVDDNSMLRDNIVARLQGNYELCFESGNANALLSFLERCEPVSRPALVLMDIEMDEMDGIEATAKLKATHPEIKVAMLTVFEQEEKVWQSIMAGADGYILKDESRERLLGCIEDILAGGSYMTPSIARKALNMMQQNSSTGFVSNPATPLTKRELEILTLVTKGLSYKQIADQLFISVSTAKTHIHHIYEKLQVNNKMEAARKMQGLPSQKS